jgi:RNA polymerase sigma-70 factor (ECF subfamily)
MTADTLTPDAAAPPTAETDAELARHAAGGDARAVERLVRRYNRLLFRSARGVVGDDAEAQDVVQETYLRAIPALAAFRGDCALGTWLVRIALNVGLDLQRRRRRSVPVDATIDLGTEPAPEHRMAFDAPAATAPDARLQSRQERALLQQAIDGLPPIYRSVFILRAVQELSVAETAACLDVGEDVVRTRFLRGRALLRDALGARLEAHAQDVYAFAGARCDAVVAHVLARLRREGFVPPDR